MIYTTVLGQYLVFLLVTQINYAHSAKKKHVVFDVMNNLVREVPRWLAPNLDQNKIITFKAVDRRDSSSTRDYFFMKMHYVEKMMTKLSKNPDVVISFYSGDQKFLVQPVLEALKLHNNDKTSFFDLASKSGGKILYRVDTVDTWNQAKIDEMKDKWYDKSTRWRKDLSKITTKLDSIVFISSIDNSVLDSQKQNHIFHGHPYFYAKSYQDAEAKRLAKKDFIARKPWHAKNYPNSKEEWENDFYKNAYVHLVLKEVLSAKNVLSELSIRLAENKNHLTHIGMKMLDNTWKLKKYTFSIKEEKVTGCSLMNMRTLETISSASLGDCLNDNTTDYDWIYDHDNLAVSQCVLRDADTGAYIQDEAISECLNVKENNPYWKGQGFAECSVYTSNMYYIKSVELNQCQNEHVLYKESIKKNILVEYFDGMEKLSLEDVLAKLSFNTTISLKKYNYSNETMNGISYPRINHMMYRGMHPGQMSLEKAFKAMFGDMFSPVESMIVTILKYYLMKQSPPISNNYSPLNLKAIANNILKKFDTSLDHDEALRVSIEYLDKEMQKRGDTALRNELIDQYSGTFNEWGGAGLYTAPFYDIAKLYGPNVVAFKEKEARGVDKTFFQYKKYGNSNWPRVDSGEYIVPLYIPADEIEGIHIAASFSNYASNPYKEAFYKIKHKGEILIAAIKSKGCIIKGMDGLIYECRSNFSSTAFPGFPTKTKKAKIKAIFGLCKSGDSCSIPKAIKKKFNIVGGNIDSQLLRKINSMNIFGNKVVRLSN